MKRLLDILANGLSVLFYPLWIPTYGMILFCLAVTQVVPLPFNYWLVTVGATLLLTGLLPVGLILLQVRRGDIEDIYIHKKEERTLAYVETVGCFACWWYLLSFVLHAPAWLCGVALGGTIAIACVALINRWWKISAHLTGMGGLVGGIVAYQLYAATASFSLWLPLVVMGVAWLVMLVRLYVNAHTPWQVIAGFALGMACTLLIPLCYV